MQKGARRFSAQTHFLWFAWDTGKACSCPAVAGVFARHAAHDSSGFYESGWLLA